MSSVDPDGCGTCMGLLLSSPDEPFLESVLEGDAEKHKTTVFKPNHFGISKRLSDSYNLKNKKNALAPFLDQ